MRRIGKAGKGEAFLWVFGFIAVASLLFATGVIKLSPQSSVPSGDVATPGNVDFSGCSDTKLTAFTANVYNNENTTGSETFDVTAYLYKRNSDGSLERVTTITDTTAPSATNIDCGYDYVLKPVAADGAGGDNSKLETVKSGIYGSIVSGNLEFSARSATQNYDIGGSQHGVLEFQAYDNIAKGNIFDTGDSSATDYETTGVVFMSSTGNTTLYSETNGVDVSFTVRSTGSDTNFNDKGFYILLDNFDTTKWDVPVVRVNGAILTEISDQLNSDEKKAYTAYEYVYFVDTKVLDAPQSMDVRVSNNLLTGATATSNVTMSMAPRGGYLSVDGTSVKIGSVKDDISQTAVFTIQSLTLGLA